MLDLHCVKCHGPLEQKSGLELDNLAAVMKGGDDGVSVVIGKPEESNLWKYLKADGDPHMPPKKQLSEGEIDGVKQWISSLSAPPLAEAVPPPIAMQDVPREVPAAIDFFLDKTWKSHQVIPAAICDDRTFAHRVWVDLAGRIPTLEELQEFVFSSAPDKRTQLVDRLLASPEYARNFREIWDVLLMGRGTDRKWDRRKDSGWHQFLEQAFQQNRPWNDVVRDMIEARPDAPEKKGAHWFLFERKNDHQAMAEAVAPVIYGTRLDCAQCHDHPLAREIKQGHYWGLVAAFNRSKNTEGGPAAVTESAVGGFINFSNLKKESQPALITMLTGATISEDRPAEGSKEDDTPDKYIEVDKKPKVPKFSRRGALANAATKDNPLLAKAFVNRLWAQLFGRGIVHPADEINSRNAAAEPELLEWLSQEFAKSHYDIKKLVRGLVLSSAYQRGAARGDNQPPPEVFAAALEKPLTGEALARSMAVALGRPNEADGFIREVTSRFTDIQARDYNTTTQQAMFLTNSPNVSGLLKPVENSTIAQLLAIKSPEERGKALFLRLWGRTPDAEELGHSVAFLKSKPDREEAALQELAWAMLTSPEFLMNQ